ncbi:hypothetical protein Acr_06g0013070 [Actinidia rufa]|uniref:Uncharacterized protein n=1 Tax=Actinidia rufa TaxID=165716 RepID=A0A7J0EUV5_9ERIC|nr:hypothetical protein Acr_06g0013070 [Actinidia rufa]
MDYMPEFCATAGATTASTARRRCTGSGQPLTPLHLATMAAAVTAMAILYHHQNKKHRHLGNRHNRRVGRRLMRI